MKRLTLLLLLLFPVSVNAAVYYVNGSTNSGWEAGNDSNNGLSKSTPFLTIGHGVDAMSGGDTLIIADGIYAGDENCISRVFHRPPSGSSDGYTRISAENDGRVILDGSDMSYGPFEIYGNITVDGTGGSGSECEYIHVQGLIAKDSTRQGFFIRNTQFVKVINCGAVNTSGDTSVMLIDRSRYVLFEGCYTWGYSRYSFQTFHADHSIFRNCVARFDRTETSEPIGAFSIYSSTNMEVQNCIVTDSDQERFWIVPQYPDTCGCFGAPTTEPTEGTGPVNFTNCIGINNEFMLFSSSWNNYAADTHFTNCIGWDIGTSAYSFRALNSRGHMTVNNLTYGGFTATNINTPVINAKADSDGYDRNNYIYNSVFVDFDYGPRVLFSYWDSVDTCNIFNMTGTGGSVITPTNTKTYDPETNGLLYLPRIESGSRLETDGIGANILKMYGKPGTLWGEAGYNLLQDGTDGQADINLWPFPNEAIIKEHMATYTYTGTDNDGTTGTIDGARGFCADTNNPRTDTGKVTLTSYIWEYLGNTDATAELYDMTSPDQPSGGGGGGGGCFVESCVCMTTRFLPPFFAR